jgi:hypothetical protein
LIRKELRGETEKKSAQEYENKGRENCEKRKERGDLQGADPTPLL